MSPSITSYTNQQARIYKVFKDLSKDLPSEFGEFSIFADIQYYLNNEISLAALAGRIRAYIDLASIGQDNILILDGNFKVNKALSELLATIETELTRQNNLSLDNISLLNTINFDMQAKLATVETAEDLANAIIGAIDLSNDDRSLTFDTMLAAINNSVNPPSSLASSITNRLQLIAGSTNNLLITEAVFTDIGMNHIGENIIYFIDDLNTALYKNPLGEFGAYSEWNYPNIVKDLIANIEGTTTTTNLANAIVYNIGNPNPIISSSAMEYLIQSSLVTVPLIATYIEETLSNLPSNNYYLGFANAITTSLPAITSNSFILDVEEINYAPGVLILAQNIINNIMLKVSSSQFTGTHTDLHNAIFDSTFTSNTATFNLDKVLFLNAISNSSTDLTTMANDLVNNLELYLLRGTYTSDQLANAILSNIPVFGGSTLTNSTLSNDIENSLINPAIIAEYMLNNLTPLNGESTATDLAFALLRGIPNTQTTKYTDLATDIDLFMQENSSISNITDNLKQQLPLFVSSTYDLVKILENNLNLSSTILDNLVSDINNSLLSLPNLVNIINSSLSEVETAEQFLEAIFSLQAIHNYSSEDPANLLADISNSLLSVEQIATNINAALTLISSSELTDGNSISAFTIANAFFGDRKIYNQQVPHHYSYALDDLLQDIFNTNNLNGVFGNTDTAKVVDVKFNPVTKDLTAVTMAVNAKIDHLIVEVGNEAAIANQMIQDIYTHLGNAEALNTETSQTLADSIINIIGVEEETQSLTAAVLQADIDQTLSIYPLAENIVTLMADLSLLDYQSREDAAFAFASTIVNGIKASSPQLTLNDLKNDILNSIQSTANLVQKLELATINSSNADTLASSIIDAINLPGQHFLDGRQLSIDTLKTDIENSIDSLVTLLASSIASSVNDSSVVNSELLADAIINKIGATNGEHVTSSNLKSDIDHTIVTAYSIAQNMISNILSHTSSTTDTSETNIKTYNGSSAVIAYDLLNAISSSAAEDSALLNNLGADFLNTSTSNNYLNLGSTIANLYQNGLGLITINSSQNDLLDVLINNLINSSSSSFISSTDQADLSSYISSSINDSFNNLKLDLYEALSGSSFNSTSDLKDAIFGEDLISEVFNSSDVAQLKTDLDSVIYAELAKAILTQLEALPNKPSARDITFALFGPTTITYDNAAADEALLLTDINSVTLRIKDIADNVVTQLIILGVEATVDNMISAIYGSSFGFITNPADNSLANLETDILSMLPSLSSIASAIANNINSTTSTALEVKNSIYNNNAIFSYNVGNDNLLENDLNFAQTLSAKVGADNINGITNFNGTPVDNSLSAVALALDDKIGHNSIQNVGITINNAIGNTPLNLLMTKDTHFTPNPTQVAETLYAQLNAADNISSISSSAGLAKVIINSIGAAEPQINLESLTTLIESNSGTGYSSSVSVIAEEMSLNLQALLQRYSPEDLLLTEDVILALLSSNSTHEPGQGPINVSENLSMLTEFATDIATAKMVTITSALLGIYNTIGSLGGSSDSNELIGNSTLIPILGLATPTDLSNAENLIASAIGSTALNEAGLLGNDPSVSASLKIAIDKINAALGNESLLENSSGIGTFSGIIGTIDIGLLGSSGTTIATAIGNSNVANILLGNTPSANVLSDALVDMQGVIGSTAVSHAILGRSAPNNVLSDAIYNIENAIGTVTPGLLHSSSMSIAHAIGSTDISMIGDGTLSGAIHYIFNHFCSTCIY